MRSVFSAYPLAITGGTDPQVGTDISHIITVCLVLVVLLVIGMTALAWLRRWSKRNDDVPATGFTTDALRRLHKEGKMSDEEYKRTSELVKKAQRAQFLAQADKPPAPRPKSNQPKS